MPEPKRPLKVFLCHAHADRDPVRGLYARLKREGVDVWLDKEKLLPGADWELEIRKAVREADVVIVCLSKQFNQAGFRQKEVRIALEEADKKPEGAIFIIPARLEECDNLESLNKWHWVDLFESDGFQRLLLALRLRAEKIGAALGQRGHTISRPKINTEQEAARESVEKETAEKSEKGVDENAHLESEEQTRQKAAREFAEKSEREAAEKTAREKAEKEATEKARQRARQKASKEKAEREIAEKITHEKSERHTAREAAIAKFFSNVKPFLRVIGIFGIVIILFWGGSLVISKFIPPVRVTPTSTEFIPTKAPASTPYTGSLDVQITDAKGVPMVLVPAGEFTMGSDQQQSEQPVHRIYLEDYYIDKFEVTNEMYRLCVEDNESPCGLPSPSRIYNDPLYKQHPVVFVTWYMAKVYCEYRGASLPTEAQWEKAARGADERTYPWGENIDSTYANYANNEGGSVGVSFYEKGRSQYSAYNMAGNVWEWTNSLFRPYPYNASDGREDMSVGGNRVIRGGSWNISESSVRSANRESFTPESALAYVGFRCARDVNP